MSFYADPKTRSVTIGSTKIENLGDIQFRFLEVLIRAKGCYVSDEGLKEYVYERDTPNPGVVKGLAFTVRERLRGEGVRHVIIEWTRNDGWRMVEGVKPPLTRREREQRSEELANDFFQSSIGPDAAMEMLVQHCIVLHREGCMIEAIELSKLFRAEIQKKCPRQPLNDPAHVAMLDLLDAGFPENATYIQPFANLNYRNLIQHPDYIALLHGIRLSEMNPPMAAETLQKALSRYVGQFRHCALIEYVIGQCLSRDMKTKEALMRFHRALEMANHLGKSCKCGASCSTNGLLAEIYRGTAVAYRRDGQLTKSFETFEKGEAYLSKKVDEQICGEYQFSQGYLHLQTAQDPKLTERDRRGNLEEARAKFAGAHEYRPSWSAPVARLGIALYQLGEPAESVVDWFMLGHMNSEGERFVEAQLTRAMCGLGALYLTPRCNPLPPLSKRFNSETVFGDLVDLYRGERLVAKGPRKCHASDSRLIVKSATAEKLGPLWKIYHLLQMAEKWEYENLEGQHRHIEEFRSENTPTTEVSGGIR